jgi:hypothetical protein
MTLIILCGFTAALFWWIGITGVANTGGGAQVFLAIPLLATIGTVLLASRRGRQKAKHVNQARSPKSKHVSQLQNHQGSGTRRPAKRTSLVVLCGFTAALCWWIGIAGVANTGGGAQVFLAIPLLATIGTVLVARYQGPGYRKAAS